MNLFQHADLERTGSSYTAQVRTRWRKRSLALFPEGDGLYSKIRPYGQVQLYIRTRVPIAQYPLPDPALSIAPMSP